MLPAPTCRASTFVDARPSYQRALELVTNDSERRFFLPRLAAVMSSVAK